MDGVTRLSATVRFSCEALDRDIASMSDSVEQAQNCPKTSNHADYWTAPQRFPFNRSGVGLELRFQLASRCCAAAGGGCYWGSWTVHPQAQVCQGCPGQHVPFPVRAGDANPRHHCFYLFVFFEGVQGVDGRGNLSICHGSVLRLKKRGANNP